MTDKQNDFYSYCMKTTKALIDRIANSGNDYKSVCICGSSKFCDLVAVVKWELEKKGIMATGLNFLPEWYVKGADWDKSHHGAEQEGVADVLDAVHLRKIYRYNCIVVVNYDKYIGERTAIEIEYANKIGKEVFYWEI